MILRGSYQNVSREPFWFSYRGGPNKRQAFVRIDAMAALRIVPRHRTHMSTGQASAPRHGTRDGHEQCNIGRKRRISRNSANRLTTTMAALSLAVAAACR
ncbi:MAG: hypothetical protein CR217_12530 [Beijerinckiaceae bacterium]|nr:MAG: hypothetical protein CR217_12530 [Beijerinckiaceae bacterium]